MKQLLHQIGWAVLGICLSIAPVQAQEKANDFFNLIPYGSLHLSVSFQPGAKAKSASTLSLSGSLGILADNAGTFEPSFFITSSFLKGEIGTSLIPVGRPNTRFEVALGAACTYSGGNQRTQVQHYTFGNTFHANSAAHVLLPYSNSLTLGTHFVFSKDRSQQIGFTCLKLKMPSKDMYMNSLSFHYYNDGVPFGWLGLADTFDRWWTGGGSIEYVLDRNTDFRNPSRNQWRFAMGFDKFTGGGKTATSDAYGFVNRVLIRQVDYTLSEYKEIFYNRGIFFAEVQFGRFAGRLSTSSDLFDVQHLIHTIRKDAFHVKYEKTPKLVVTRFGAAFAPNFILEQ
ncbi:MAG: hypothetical protein GYB31_17605 [Bacteroidetes bacterium]|nr:hypothetical protein [Bacteroidota bacterium]